MSIFGRIIQTYWIKVKQKDEGTQILAGIVTVD